MSAIKVSKPVPSSVWASPPDPTSRKDKSILITGGSGGLGAAFVEKFALAGAYVTFVDVKEEMGNELASRLQSEGHRTQFVRADVTDWPELTQAFKSAIRFSPTGDAIGHVIINAGLLDGPFFTGFDPPLESLDVDPPQPDIGPIEVNVKGAMYTLKLAQLYMGMNPSSWQPGSKSIMFILSPECYWTLPGFVTYAGARFGTRGLFRASREMMACKGIRVNGLSPALMETPQTIHVRDALQAVGAAFTPIDEHVTLATHLLVNESIVGRAISAQFRFIGGEVATKPEDRYMDLQDDEEGYDAGKIWWEWARKAAPKGDESQAETLRGLFEMLYQDLGFDIDAKSPRF
jgi:5'-hydroxyaverantin dehydrogenase